ncbi:9588_t:CDS:2, partial [Dentiscutata heterogama]
KLEKNIKNEKPTLDKCKNCKKKHEKNLECEFWVKKKNILGSIQTTNQVTGPKKPALIKEIVGNRKVTDKEKKDKREQELISIEIEEYIKSFIRWNKTNICRRCLGYISGLWSVNMLEELGKVDLIQSKAGRAIKIFVKFIKEGFYKEIWSHHCQITSKWKKEKVITIMEKKSCFRKKENSKVDKASLQEKRTRKQNEANSKKAQILELSTFIELLSTFIMSYEWQAPKEGDVRSPCPALNAMANHGYLPRDGKNITPRQLFESLQKVFNEDALLATFQVAGCFTMYGKWFAGK